MTGQPDLRLTEQHGPLQNEGEPVEEALLQLGRQPHLLGLAEDPHQPDQQHPVQRHVQ